MNSPLVVGYTRPSSDCEIERRKVPRKLSVSVTQTVNCFYRRECTYPSRLLNVKLPPKKSQYTFAIGRPNPVSACTVCNAAWPVPSSPRGAQDGEDKAEEGRPSTLSFASEAPSLLDDCGESLTCSVTVPSEGRGKKTNEHLYFDEVYGKTYP